MTYSGKKMIIIGATSGIGRKLAELYCRAGWQVGITGRRAHLLQELQQSFPAQIVTECFDVRTQNNIPHLESLIRQLGGLDLLIYNAGYGEVSDQLDPVLDKITYETNVQGFIEIANYTFNLFALKQHGHIAATSSIAANRGNSRAPAYSASKAFMSVYMEGLYIKARKMKLNIAVTDIQPGFIDTKAAKGTGQFWVVPAEKAARQIFNGIQKKKWRIYVSPRWWLIAQLMKWAPGWLYHRVA